MTTRTTHRTLAAALLLATISTTALAEDQETDFTAAIAVIEPSCVRVEYTLRYDNGEPPECSGWRQRCPNCGGYHRINDCESCVNEKRPKIVSGYLLSPTQVITADPEIHPRFVEKIEVRAGEQLVRATIESYPIEQNALILKLAEPLAAAQPLKFNAEGEGPYCAVAYYAVEAQWGYYARPLPEALATKESGVRRRPVPGECVIVNEAGAAVGMTMKAELPLSDSWKGSPLDWHACSAAEMAATLKKIETIARNAMPIVTLKFRSPKSEEMDRWGFRSSDSNVDTELRTYGMLVGEKQLLIPANLEPAATARLEQIDAQFPDGHTAKAQFVCSFREFAGLLAELETPQDGALAFDQHDVFDLQDILTYSVYYKLYGDTPVVRVQHARVPTFEIGHRGRVYPDMPKWETDPLLFREDGTLCAANATIRRIQGSRWSREDNVLTPVAFFAEQLADPATHADTSNVPLSAEHENRIAWLGIDMQMLDSDLARVNKVSQYTEDGDSGVIVSYVYPDSPAAQAGIKPGDILLRLYFEDEPKPLAVEADNSDKETFPWHRLDELSEEYFDRIPQPWPPIENDFTKMLTRAGFGRKVRAEFFIDGEIVMKEFKVVESPPHYESAPRFKSEKLGITVRDLTYEVRRYFQRSADDPGIIVSKIEQGSKASVAGMKPYEIITHVNDEPIASVAEFEKILETATGELRLNVKRMTQGRIVKIRLD